MATTLDQELATIEHGFDTEPTMSRHSHSFGTINLYAPDLEPSMWRFHPWLFLTEHGPAGVDSAPLRHLILSEHIQHVFHHPFLIAPMHIWPES